MMQKTRQKPDDLESTRKQKIEKTRKIRYAISRYPVILLTSSGLLCFLVTVVSPDHAILMHSNKKRNPKKAEKISYPQKNQKVAKLDIFLF